MNAIEAPTRLMLFLPRAVHADESGTPDAAELSRLADVGADHE